MLIIIMEEEAEIVEPVNSNTHLIPSLIAGYLSGIGHIMFSHPFDTLKVRALIIDSNAIRINWCIKSIQKYG